MIWDVKKKLYSITDKLAVIASVKLSESQANMFHGNSVPESTIQGWLRDEGKLCGFEDRVNFTDQIKRKKPRTVL